GGADHGVDAVVDQPGDVVGGGGGDDEVDRDLCPGRGHGGQIVAAADPGDELEVVGVLDGAAGGGAHAAGGAEHGDAGGVCERRGPGGSGGHGGSWGRGGAGRDGDGEGPRGGVSARGRPR